MDPFISERPDDPWLPAALLLDGYARSALGDLESGHRSFARVIAISPGSVAAERAATALTSKVVSPDMFRLPDGGSSARAGGSRPPIAAAQDLHVTGLFKKPFTLDQLRAVVAV